VEALPKGSGGGSGLNNKVKDLSTELKDKVLLDKFDLAFKITSIPSPIE
jgi:hypothetical protein